MSHCRIIKFTTIICMNTVCAAIAMWLLLCFSPSGYTARDTLGTLSCDFKGSGCLIQLR
jgi:hypothetical protein